MNPPTRKHLLRHVAQDEVSSLLHNGVLQLLGWCYQAMTIEVPLQVVVHCQVRRRRRRLFAHLLRVSASQVLVLGQDLTSPWHLPWLVLRLKV